METATKPDHAALRARRAELREKRHAARQARIDVSTTQKTEAK